MMKTMVNCNPVDRGGFAVPCQSSHHDVSTVRSTTDAHIPSTDPSAVSSPSLRADGIDVPINLTPPNTSTFSVTSCSSTTSLSSSGPATDMDVDLNSTLPSSESSLLDSFTSPVVEPSLASTPNRQSPSSAFALQPPPVVNVEEVATSSSESSGGLLSAELIKKLCVKSCSRQNFAAKLVAVMFDEQTRKRSNVGGKLGKIKLNPILIAHIKSLVFQHFPLEEDEREATEWSRCVVAIDEKNRRLNKSSKAE